MALVFLRLRLRIAANSLRKAGPVATILYGLLAAASLALSGGVIGMFAARRASATTDTDWLVQAVFTISFALWLLPVVLTPGGGTGLSLSALAPFPLTARQKMIGLLTASIVGIGPPLTLLVTLGAVIGYAPAGLGAVFVVVAGLTQLLVCITVARGIAGLLEAVLQSRRAQDLGVVVIGVLVIAYYVIVFSRGGMMSPSVPSDTDSPPSSPTSEPEGSAWWTYSPPSALARAVIAGANGDYAISAAAIAYGLALSAGALTVWTWAVSRQGKFRESRSVTRSGTRGLSVLPRWASPLLPNSPAGAVAAKELRYLFFRSPPRSMQYLSGIVLSVLLVGRLLLGTGRFAPFAAVAVAFFVTANTTSGAFNFDGPRYWAYVVAGVPGIQLIRGSQLAAALPVGLLCVMITVGVSIWTGDWRETAAALLFAAAAFFVAAAFGAQMSARSPVPHPTSSHRARDERTKFNAVGCLGGLSIVFEVAVLAPAAGIAAVSYSAWGTTLPGAAVGLAYAVPLWWFAITNAGRYVDDHHPEILAALAIE
jgi:ABC-2 type transport system permease protein